MVIPIAFLLIFNYFLLGSDSFLNNVAQIFRGKGDFRGLLKVVFALGECLLWGPFHDFYFTHFLTQKLFFR